MDTRWIGLVCWSALVATGLGGCGDGGTGADAAAGDGASLQDGGRDAAAADQDGGAPPLTSELIVLAWNDRGMNFITSSYDKLAILPPYNTLWAQLLEPGDPPRIVTRGVTVEYRLLNNTSSADKGDYGQFWENSRSLFGMTLETDKGLNLADPTTHNGLSGQMVLTGDHFEVHGIPATPLDDDLTHNPYQIAEIVVRNSVGAVLGRTQATVPVSDEMNCAKCHGGDALQNILTEHPEVDGQSLVDQQPVLCASCHGSPVLGSAAGDRGSAGSYLSEAIHRSHVDRSDASENPIACYDCHPGDQTEFHRSVAHDSYEGNCESCHGSLAYMSGLIAANTKVPWVDEPGCTDCHQDIAEVETGSTLFRNASGHGGLSCPACHQSPHALVPSRVAADNYQSLQYQGKAATIGSCSACHDNSRGPDKPFAEFLETHAGADPQERAACHVCHTALPTNASTENWPHKFEWRPR